MSATGGDAGGGRSSCCRTQPLLHSCIPASRCYAPMSDGGPQQGGVEVRGSAGESEALEEARTGRRLRSRGVSRFCRRDQQAGVGAAPSAGGGAPPPAAAGAGRPTALAARLPLLQLRPLSDAARARPVWRPGGALAALPPAAPLRHPRGARCGGTRHRPGGLGHLCCLGPRCACRRAHAAGRAARGDVCREERRSRPASLSLPDTGQLLCYLNVEADEAIRSLFINHAAGSLLTVSVFSSGGRAAVGRAGDQHARG